MILAFLDIGASELAIFAVVAIMLFGKNLPQVARQVGRGWSDLKKGMSSIQSEFNAALYSEPTAASSRPSRSYANDDEEEQTAPKFVPPPEEPSAAGRGDAVTR